MTSTNKTGPIGYGKPPDHSKFQKGKSGNPAGRRRAEKSHVWEDPIKATLTEEITVVVNGKKIKIPAYQALLRVLRAKGLKGDTKAIQMLFTETDGLRSLIEQKKNENHAANLAVIDAILKKIDDDDWNAEGKNNDGRQDQPPA